MNTLAWAKLAHLPLRALDRPALNVIRLTLGKLDRLPRCLAPIDVFANVLGDIPGRTAPSPINHHDLKPRLNRCH